MTARGRLAGSIAFGATMGFFEAAVVVYLRRLWELGAIDVATAQVSNRLVLTEVLREAASLAMIATVGILAGRRALDRLAHAAVIFGVWDILYYVYLSALIGWPASLLDWDVLFLIPKPWVGPVLAPVLVSVALIGGGAYLVLHEEQTRGARIPWPAWAAALFGGGVVIASFLLPEAPKSPADPPAGFSWVIFLVGLGIALAGFAPVLTGAPRRSASRAREFTRPAAGAPARETPHPEDV